MRTLFTLVILATVSNADAAEPRKTPDLGLPEALRGYKSWTPLLSEPREVALSSWSLCRSPTPAALASRFGPHATPLVMVFSTPDVATGMAALERKPFPLGAVIAKEKLLSRDGPAQGVAFMVKRMTPAFADSGGWEFRYYPTSPEPAEARRTHEHCASCHRRAAGSDYVFRTYGAAREVVPRPDETSPPEPEGEAH